jgi:hypothetical protein
MGAQHAGEVVVGELAALVGIEDLGQPVAERVLQGFDAEARIEQIRQAPSQHVAAHPVHHGDQIEKPARHGNVGDIGRPHLADPLAVCTSCRSYLDMRKEEQRDLWSGDRE